MYFFSLALKHISVCGCGKRRLQTPIPQESTVPEPTVHKAACQLQGSHAESSFGSKRPMSGNHLTKKEN